MTSNDLWIVSIKLRHLAGSTLDEDGSEFYFVECLVPASSDAQAIQTTEQLLQEKKLSLAEVLKCEVYDPDLWQSVQHFSDIDDAAEYAKLNNEPKSAQFISSSAMEFDEDDENDIDEVEWD